MLLAFALLFAGAYASLHSDLTALASQQVDAGGDALQASLASRSDVVRSAVLQAAAQQQLEDALARGDAAALHGIAADLALSAGLSFVVVTGPSGKILAGNRTRGGPVLAIAPEQSAAMGSMVSGVTPLSAREASLLTGSTASAPALAILTASPVTVAGRTIGVVTGGEFVDAGTRAVGDVGKFTGGEAAIVYDGRVAATSIAGKDGAPATGIAVPNASVVATRGTFDGRETVGGVDYFARIAPLTDYSGNVAGAYWFGVPYARFEELANHTLAILAFWAFVGVAIAVAFGVFVADRIGAKIAQRSRQVNESARELRVLVVGGEVSGDHVDRTREKLERIEELVGRLVHDGNSSDVGRLRELASEAVGDVVVIDTLTGELSSRLRDAAARVEQLGEVARALDALVAGTRPSRN
jgi:hypothetical protein